MPCRSEEAHQRLDGTYCIHLQNHRYSKQATSKKQADTVYDPEYGGSTFLRNVDVSFQNIAFFIISDVWTSDLTYLNAALLFAL
jgi:hypothetical protein